MDTKDIATKLSEKGLRVTPQRIAIMSAIHTLNNHPTAENIIDYIKNNHPNISDIINNIWMIVFDIINNIF